jgi:hypothetical protein
MKKMKKISIIIILFAISFIAKCQFKGGSGDGYNNSTIYTQPYISIFVGGQSDGFATVFYNQVSTPLPIKIIYFNAKKEGDFVKLEWKTSSEINASHFEIERSIDALKFVKIGNQTLNESRKYEFLDSTPPSGVKGLLVYYRLKLLDFDGKSSYSKVINIANDANNQSVGNFYPNPSTENFSNIKILAEQKGEWKITKLDISGRIIKTENRILEKGLNTITVFNIEKGLNIIQFENEKNREIRKLILNN